MNVQSPLRILTATDSRQLALSLRRSCLVFEDPILRALLERVQRIAPSDATAPIIGETGTGKNSLLGKFTTGAVAVMGPVSW